MMSKLEFKVRKSWIKKHHFQMKMWISHKISQRNKRGFRNFMILNAESIEES